MGTDLLAASWKSIVLRGLIGIGFGLFAIFLPVHTVLGLAILWGIWALVDGIGLFITAFTPGTSVGGRVLAILLGLIGLIAGIYAITSPGDAAKVLTWVLGIWLIVRGLFTILAAFTSQLIVPKGLAIVSGILDIVLGALFVSHPGKSAVGIAVLLGVLAVAWGVAFVLIGFAMRKIPPADSTVVVV